MENIKADVTLVTGSKTSIIKKLDEVYNEYVDAFVDPHQPGDFIAADEFSAFHFHMKAIERIVQCK